jgi:PAS domain S-box-containing protein
MEFKKDKEFYRNILDQMIEGYVMQASDGSIIDYNNAALKILGLTADQLQGKTSVDPHWSCVKANGEAFPGEEHPAMVSLATGERQKDVIMGVNTLEGSYRWIQINSFPLFENNTQKPHAVYTTFKDITNEIEHKTKLENKTLELELVSERLNLAIAGSGFGVWDFYPKTGQLKWDDNMFSIFDCASDEFEGAYQAWESRLHPEDIDSAVAELGVALSGDKEFYTRFRIITRDKKIKHVGGVGKVLRDENGDAYRMVGINWDLSSQVEYEEELKKAKDAAEEAARVKSEFLANMSHEIRTPMNGILGMVSVLKETELLPEQAEIVDTISNSSKTLLVILNDILDISKIESGMMKVDNEIFSLGKVVRSALGLFQNVAASKNLDMTLNIEKDIDKKFRGDANRITQIINNLISNAVKFTHEGKISVSVNKCETGGVCLSVEDTGIGMKEDQIGKLFNPFVQGDSSITRKFGGTGLGLSISKKLANLMGGSLDVKSEFGKGSRFDLKLNLKETHEEEVVNTSFATSEDLKRFKILIVEDNPVNMLVAKKSLKKLGVENPDTAINGKLAVEQANKVDYDFILMDLQMPEMDGITATKEILNNVNGKAPKIIAMTANIFEEDREKCRQAGMSDFIPKPISLDVLRSKIR